jgi:hypothetical protein
MGVTFGRLEMSYPFYRALSFLSMLVVASLAWLWLNQPRPPALQSPGVVSEYHFNLGALELHQAAASGSAEAALRPLFKPGRKPFVPAPPPSTILTPPSISVVEDPPKEVQVTPALPVAPPPPASPAQALDSAVQTPIPAPPRIEDAGLQVRGIMINNNERRALINSTQDPAGRWLRAGESLSGWEVIGIEKSRVVLRSGAILATLQLYVD